MLIYLWHLAECPAVRVVVKDLLNLLMWVKKSFIHFFISIQCVKILTQVPLNLVVVHYNLCSPQAEKFVLLGRRPLNYSCSDELKPGIHCLEEKGKGFTEQAAPPFLAFRVWGVSGAAQS